MTDPMLAAAAEALKDSEDLAMFRDELATLRVMADEIDRGPTFPLPPSVISELIRERAAGLVGGAS